MSCSICIFTHYSVLGLCASVCACVYELHNYKFKHVAYACSGTYPFVLQTTSGGWLSIRFVMRTAWELSIPFDSLLIVRMINPHLTCTHRFALH